MGDRDCPEKINTSVARGPKITMGTKEKDAKVLKLWAGNMQE